ncbi:MAG: radical SAM protein [Candidatus Aminicenantales bacterium]
MKTNISIEVKLTDRCNQRCFYCVNDDDVESGALIDGRFFIQRLREWAEDKESSVFEIKEVRMTGGEPLLYPKAVAEIARACRRLGIRSGINTNGSLITLPLLRSLKKAGMEVVKISFDGLDKAVYGKMRDETFSPEKILRGVKAAVHNGFKVILRFTLTRYNQNELIACYQKARDLGVYKFQIKPLIDAGRAHGSNGFLAREKIHQSLAELEKVTSGEILIPEILCWPPDHLSGFKYSICGSIKKIYVCTDLRVMICNYVPVTEFIGDLTQETLDTILRGREVDIWVSQEGHRIIKGCPNRVFFDSSV